MMTVCHSRTDRQHGPDQLRALVLGQIQANSALQAQALQLRTSNSDLHAAKTEFQAANTQLQTVVKYKDAVISKITLELAQHKRLRLSKKAESLTAEQRHLFDKTLDGDTAQIEQEELDKLPVKTHW